MKFLKINILSVLTISCFFTPMQITAANVIGYFASWGIYRDIPYKPEDIPFDKLTHIQYAFFLPDSNGTGNIISSDPWGDSQNLTGRNNLVTLAHEHGVKVLPSVGGWTGSSDFPQLAASPQTRSQFCSSARALIEKYDFDGIDIDWEYPGYVQHNGTPQDGQNFVLLLAQLRDTLDAMEGERKLITLAVAGSSYHGDNFLIEDFIDDVDYVSIMTYDYSLARMNNLSNIPSDTAWHNSPLYGYGADKNWSVDRAVKYYANRGIPKEKLNIGMAFYGRTFADCRGAGAVYSGPGTGEQNSPGMIHYSTVNEMIAQGTCNRYWDTLAAVPYCLSNVGEYFSYDDTTSIRLKAQYSKDNGCGGAIIWELGAGMLSDGTQPLLDAAAKVLIEPAEVVLTQNAKFSRAAGMTKRGTIVGFTLQTPSNVSINIYNLHGRRVASLRSRFFDRGTHAMDLRDDLKALAVGSYLLEIKTREWNKRGRSVARILGYSVTR